MALDKAICAAFIGRQLVSQRIEFSTLSIEGHESPIFFVHFYEYLVNVGREWGDAIDPARYAGLLNPC